MSWGSSSFESVLRKPVVDPHDKPRPVPVDPRALRLEERHELVEVGDVRDVRQRRPARR
jgi:hypothetical protein